MKAHQRIIRERRADEDAADDLFGKWWDNVDHDISKAIVREVTHNTAKSVIERYEWLGTMPHIVQHAYGIFFDGNCGGVVTYSPEYCENLGRWDRFGFTGKIILLSRGACVHWAHPHAGSKLIRQSMKLLPPKYEIVTAMVDHRAGEIGTIYQACGFHYVGAMRARTGLVPRQKSLVIDGRVIPHRTMKQRFGTASAEKINKILGGNCEFVQDIDKGRYFAFRGCRSAKAKHTKAIAHLVRPYPKRAARPVDERAPARVSKAQPLGAAPPPK